MDAEIAANDFHALMPMTGTLLLLQIQISSIQQQHPQPIPIPTSMPPSVSAA